MQMNIEWKILMNSFKVPRIRFKEFDVIWVEKRIADIVKISAGGDVDKIKLKESGKYPVVANALTNKGIVGFYDDYKVKAPAVTVTGRGDVGYAVARHENFTPIVRLLTLQSENIDVDYLENQINSMRILNESTGVPQLTAPQLGNYKVYHPEIEEQSAIGSFFRTLDDLLVSYKDNLANYQSLKATMLSKMFPKAGQTVPEIRLDGFEGEWKKDTLEPYLTESRISGDTGLTAKKITVKLWGKGVIEKEEKYAGSSNTQYFVRKAGQFIYSKLDFQNQAFGIIPNELDGYQSTLDLPTFDIQNIDPKFLLEYVMRREFYEYQGLIANGSRKAKRIHPEDFLVMPVRIPSLEEQQAIGSYFSNIANFINSYQEKISQIETLKKKLLQDMFI